MYQNYLNEEFLNRENELCKVIEMRKHHIVFLNTKHNTEHLVYTRDYEVQTSFGSWRVLSNRTGKLLYV